MNGCGDTKQTPQQLPSTSHSQSPSPANPHGEALKCLVEGSPWEADTERLARETVERISMGQLKDFHTTGAATLTVDEELRARYAQDTTTTASMDLPAGQSLTSVVHTKGTVTGTWTEEDGKLVPTSGWDSTLTSTHTTTGGGQSSTATTQDDGIDKKPVTFTCTKDALTLTMQGSKFTIPFR
ncbi:hypothetical protein D4739_06935 [Nocardioides cavernaquae]|uniref:Lipoprotein n=2 Tax=Nocardioides cavernaquae TaxID=2321396 RepID=A0A3A5H7Z9_9ACTN|nr:hypothetical protein D4739_06935 [Nocardioides cavernaquae]